MSDALEKFYTVAEWIAKLKAVITRDRNSIQNLNPHLLQPCSPTLKISHLIGDMRFRRLTVNIILYADVHLRLTDLQPEASASL